MNYCKASELKKDMRVVFDMGSGHPMEEVCTVIEVEEALSLFSNPMVRIVVRRYNGDVIQIAPHSPDDKVNLEELS
jgi:hypothetical protein